MARIFTPNVRIRHEIRVSSWSGAALGARDASAHLVGTNPDAFVLGFFGWRTRDDRPHKRMMWVAGG